MYELWKFRDYEFPPAEPLDDVGTGPSQASMVATTDGYFNFRGNERAPRRINTLVARRTLTSEDCAIFGDVYRDLRTERGQFGRLWRRWLDDRARVEWLYAKLGDATATRTLRDFDTLPVNMHFEVASQTWSGYPWGLYATPSLSNPYFDPEFQVNASRANTFNFASAIPAGFTIENEGNTTVREVLVSILVSSQTTPMSSITVNNTTAGAGFFINQALPVGQFIRVDTGKKSIRNSTTGDGFYTNFGYVGAAELWFPVVPGTNTIVVSTPSFSGVGTISFSYYDAHE